MQNVYQVFQSDPVLHGVISYNILTGRIDICKPLWWERTTSAMSDTDFNYLMLYLEKRYGLNNENRIRRALTVVAHQNQYHPIREYLNRLEWDGTERIPYVLHHFLGAEICAYGTEVMRLFLLGAIHRVFRPGCKFELMLCLVGGQGAGKSTFFRFLACKDEWFSDDLKKIDDDNVFRKMQGHWIIEMSEMIATANARSIEDIKSFLSRSKETYKVPYATEPEDRLRQCVFGGTSNALDFLPLDRSGNRRFLPIMVHPEQAEVHILEDEAASRQYMDQLWAEAMTLYRRGKVQLKLSKEMNEQLVLLQKQFMPEDTKVGVIQAFLDDFNGDKLQQVDGRGYSSIHSIRGVLRPAFQLAVDDDLIRKNPFGFELASVIVNDSVTREAITRKQERDLLKFIKEDKHFCRHYDAIFILFHTGLRISEFCGLTISDIEFDQKRIKVDHQLQRTSQMQYVIQSPKTESGIRYVPMSEEVVACFRRILSNRVAPKVEPLVDGYAGFLFLDKNDRPMVALHWEKYMQHIVEKYNKIYRIQMPKVTPHVCRHTFCSNMAKSGMNPKTLQYIMGHSDISVTLNVYTHVQFDDAQAELLRVAEA